jgi:hypothetical protein
MRDRCNVRGDGRKPRDFSAEAGASPSPQTRNHRGSHWIGTHHIVPRSRNAPSSAPSVPSPSAFPAFCAAVQRRDSATRFRCCPFPAQHWCFMLPLLGWGCLLMICLVPLCKVGPTSPPFPPTADCFGGTFSTEAPCGTDVTSTSCRM